VGVHQTPDLQFWHAALARDTRQLKKRGCGRDVRVET
jgi:hypothetical protein